LTEGNHLQADSAYFGHQYRADMRSVSSPIDHFRHLGKFRVLTRGEELMAELHAYSPGK
jgi:hypothetical protein